MSKPVTTYYKVTKHGPECVCMYCMAKRGDQLKRPQRKSEPMTQVEPKKATKAPEKEYVPKQYEPEQRYVQEKYQPETKFVQEKYEPETIIRNKVQKAPGAYYGSECFSMELPIILGIVGCLAFLALIVGLIFLILFLAGVFSPSQTIIYASFNQSCNNNCSSSQGLYCDSTYGVCLCQTSGYAWSYTSGQCVQCSSGWTAWRDSCLKYFYTTSGYTYSQAATVCQNNGGYVAQAESVVKFNFLGTLYATDYAAVHSKALVYLNTIASAPKTFQWANGDPMNSAFWSPGEPNNSGGNSTYVYENCAAMYPSRSYKLNDLNCNSASDVYCEYFP